jgi:hypothetical protein
MIRMIRIEDTRIDGSLRIRFDTAERLKHVVSPMSNVS